MISLSETESAISLSDSRPRALINVISGMSTGEPGILVSGYSEDVVVLDDETALFQQKFVVVDNTPPRYLVYPV